MSPLRRPADPANPESFSAAPPQLLEKARKAGRSLAAERLTRRFWPLWTALIFGLALWLAGFWSLWPEAWRWAMLGVYGVLLAVLAWRGARGWTSPTKAESLSALDAGLERRAATHLDDVPALGADSLMGRALWAAHRKRLEAAAEKAKVPAPDLRLSAQDPWGLRYWALLALIGGGAAWWTGAREQAAGFFNGAPVAAAPALAAAPARLDAWITPPSYTRAAPVYLMARQGERIEIPTGSVAQFRVSGAASAPVAAIPGFAEPFAEDGPGVYTLKAELRESGAVSARLGGDVLGSWDLAVTPDNPPVVAFSELPRDGRRQALTFRVLATDDYGVTRSWVELAPPSLEALGPRAAMGELPSVDLEPSRDSRDVRVGEADLTNHPWAGIEIEAVAYAEDAAGGIGKSEPARFKLPERIFSEPMAKAIVEQRRGFARDFQYGERAQDLLEAAFDEPDDYFEDPTAYLAASIALRRLTWSLEESRAAELRPEVMELLWKSAIRLEEGDVSGAWEALQAAKRRLEEALERGASDEEISRLTEEMRQAMNDYLDALSELASRNPDALRNMQQQGGGSGETTREELERMLRQMEETAQSGARDQAQEMLNMLAEMLENLQPGAQGSGSGEGRGEGQGSGDAQADALQDMMRRQQELADETFQQGRGGQQGQGQQGEGQNGQQGQGRQGGQQGQGQRGQGQGQGEGQGQGQGQSGRGGGGLAERQNDLRRGLDGLGSLQGEGEGDPLDQAREAMERAERALREGDSRAALDAQSDALEALRDGARRLAQRRAQANQEQGGDGRSAGGESRDPFGRPRRGFGPIEGEGVELPEERARNRALEIQREIRRRSSERDRTLEELDYLNRLQRPF